MSDLVEQKVVAAALAIKNLEKHGAASYRQMAVVALEAARDLSPGGELGCTDCGRPYSRGPDLVVSDDDWQRIAPRPDGGGVLCPNCMNDRFEQIGATAVAARFTSGPFAVVMDDQG